ncbi:hypothetical protein Hanom_Chr02g00136131 [Helianthus anomalus]
MKNIEAENIVLKNEIQVLNDKVTNLEASNVALNEVVQGLVMMNEQLSSSNTSLNAKNEILITMVNDHEADKKIKLKQLEKLYVNPRAEARRIEKEKKVVEEAAEALKDKGKGKIDNVADITQFELNDDEEKEDESEEEEDSDLHDIDNYHGNDDNGDNDDDQGDSGIMIVKYSGVHQVLDYLDDTQNEEREDVNP